MDILILILVPFLYFFIALIKPYVQQKIFFNLCAICVAVSLTWVILLFLWFFDYEVSEAPIGILMGMSISGLMYKLEEVYKNKNIRNFWFVRLLIIVGGFYAALSLLKRNWDWLSLIIITCTILIVIATFLFQKFTHRDVIDEQKKIGRKFSLIKKLDDCC